MSPEGVAAAMCRLDVWWAIAGGWAIDLWLGGQTRDHHDVEVVVPRREQVGVRDGLRGDWSSYCLDPPGSPWRPWPGDELAHPAFQLQFRNEGGEFDVFLEDIEEGMWHYRRNPAVRRPVHGILVVAPSSIPVVRPEVQLLYMAKSSESKNEADFVNALPHLDTTARNWLRGALRVAHPEHPWIARL